MKMEGVCYVIPFITFQTFGCLKKKVFVGIAEFAASSKWIKFRPTSDIEERRNRSISISGMIQAKSTNSHPIKSQSIKSPR